MRSHPSPRPAAFAPGRLTAAAAILVALVAGCGAPPPPPPVQVPGSGPPAAPSATPAAVAAGEAGTPAPPALPSPTPAPTPDLAVAPLTGRLVPAELASRRPIAVMVDDQRAARPQSGFNAASVVWQAPAEGGIPRYMLVFGEGDPASVGPVRSARLYFVQWAAEWGAVYVHVGGSPQALAALRAQGPDRLAWDADEFRWGPTYLWRTTDRAAPHNVYTDGSHLRRLAERLGAGDAPAEPAWRFAPDAPLAARPAGARIAITYQANAIGYRYDRASNSWLRTVGGALQRDRAGGAVVAPRNVVVMEVAFGLLGPGQHGRLEAANVGSGRAWVATNGVIVAGTWSKSSVTAPTLLLDEQGRPLTLTVGQTFVQVIPPGTPLVLEAGSRAMDPAAAEARGVR